jgi:outer membrane receptor protein involved in Fe transport
LLDNGLGAHVQVTHTNSSADAVNTAPPTTASIGVLYEKGPISANVNWDYTSHYKSECATCTEVYGWPVYTDAYAWVTAAVHYKFFDNFDVYVEGRNLTDAIVRSYLNNNPNLVWANGMATGQSASGVGYGYTAYGRTFVFGLAYRF